VFNPPAPSTLFRLTEGDTGDESSYDSSPDVFPGKKRPPAAPAAPQNLLPDFSYIHFGQRRHAALKFGKLYGGRAAL
jgi:hypothetical protein